MEKKLSNFKNYVTPVWIHRKHSAFASETSDREIFCFASFFFFSILSFLLLCFLCDFESNKVLVAVGRCSAVVR